MLDSLGKISGVNGAAIFRGDECLEHRLQAPLEPLLLLEALQHLQNLSDFNTSLDEDSEVSHLFVRFDRGLLLVRKVEEFLIMVLAEAGVNPAILQVGFNAAASKLIRICQGSEGSNSLSGRFSSMSSGYRTSQSESSLERFWDSAVPTDAVGAAFVWELVNSYKRHAGPNAAQTLDEELDRLEVTPMTLRNHQVEGLVQALARRLVNPQSRSAFSEEVFDMRRMV